MQNTSYGETQTILQALEFALAKGGFKSNAGRKKTAQTLIRKMKSGKSVSGRHRQLTGILKKGATIEQMINATGTSRRTIFRYLNHFEEAGLTLVLEDGRYRVE